MTLREAIDQPSLLEQRNQLRDYRSRSTTLLLPEHWHKLSELKHAAVAADDQLTAKAVWCLETIGGIQDQFVSAFSSMSSGEFKEAWDELERCEIELIFLDKHFREMEREFGVEHVRVHTRRFQDLYPFKWGISPAFLNKEIRCSICDAKLTLRVGCEHRVGEIYDGEMCSRVIKDIQILHFALVDNPVQKYSVIFSDGNNDDRFILIKYPVAALRSPWDGWNYRKEERRQYHPAFRRLRRNELCPCRSGLKYKLCCLNKDIVFPHFELSFEKKPLIELPRLEVHIEGGQ